MESVMLGVVVVLQLVGVLLLMWNARRLEATVDRIEQAVAGGRLLADRRDDVVGETLNRMERATDVVADNLAASGRRADDAAGPDGSAADAALRSAKP